MFGRPWGQAVPVTPLIDQPVCGAGTVLHELYADVRARLGRDVPINILTVRPATQDEIDLQRWHDEKVGQWVRNRP
jgi:hypothetical protein